MRNKKEKGSILLMSATLLAVVTIIGTMIVTVFFKAYVDIMKDINYQKERIEVQVAAQEIYATLDVTIPEDLPDNVIYDEVEETYSYTCSNERFKIEVLLNKDLKIIKWQVRET